MEKSVILLIEFQNQWTEKGLYHTLIKKELEKKDVLANTRRLLNNARQRGIPVIHAPLVIDPGNKRGWLARLTFGRVFTKGTWRAEISTGLFNENDEIVEGRYGFDAFPGSNLEVILNRHSAATVFVCGFTTDMCVAKTMRTMEKKGFKAVMVRDCTATFSPVRQKLTERKFVSMESSEIFTQ